MAGETVIAILESTVCLVMLMVIFFKLLPALRLEGFRQDMFAIRDEFFDYAASGRIGFNDPAYRLLRQSMNGTIRYAHNLTFFRACMILADSKLRVPQPKLTWSEKWERALENIRDDKVRADLIAFHERLMALTVQRLVLGSPVLLFVIFFVGILMVLRKGLLNLKELFVDAANITVSRFLDPRLLEERAALTAAA